MQPLLMHERVLAQWGQRCEDLAFSCLWLMLLCLELLLLMAGQQHSLERSPVQPLVLRGCLTAQSRAHSLSACCKVEPFCEVFAVLSSKQGLRTI